MRQSKKLLSVLLAVIMVFSTVAVAANAAASPWKDSAISGQYESDKPVLTTEQYATAALDDVDRMLREENMVFTQDDIFVGELDLTSIDSALDGVVALVEGTLWQQFKGMLGDLYNLDVSALKTVRRTTAGKTDVDVINSLLKFLYDNKQLFVDFVSGDIDLGSLLTSLISMDDLDVSKMAKKFIYEFTYDQDAPDNITQSVDTMVQDLIDKYVVTGSNADPNKPLEPLAPTMAGHTNISSGSTYDFIDNALKILYNDLLVPRANEVWLNSLNKTLAKYPEQVLAYKNFLNITDEGLVNFTIPTFEFTSASFISQLNNVIGSIVNTALASGVDFSWASGPNSMIITNVIAIGKQVLVNTGSDFFASYVEIKTPAEVNAMNDMEVCSYVARTIINSSIRGVVVPNTADSLIEVANYTVKGIMATEMPERDYSNETAYPVDSLDTLYNILADFAVKALNDNPGLGLDYGIGIDAVATAGANWVINEYGGLLSGINLRTSDSGWTNADKLIFAIIDRSIFDASQFPNSTVTLESLVKNVLLENVLNLNLTPLFNLLEAQPSGSELNNSPKQVLLNVVPRVLNIVFPGLLSTSMTSFDDIIVASNLASTVNALFSDLYNYRTTLVAAVLPIVCDSIGLTTAQKFKSPDFSIESFNYNASGAANFDFTITNPSSGINTGYTDANGVFHQDSRYSIKIKSVTSNLSSITIAQPSNSVLNGGDYVTLKITGSFTGTQNFIVSITYDVLTEDGTALTSEPIVARIYSCLSKTNTDDIATASASSGKFSIVDGEKNIYVTSVGGLDNLSYRVKNGSDATVTASATSAAASTSSLYKNITDISYIDVSPDTVEIPAGVQANVGIYKISDAYTGTEAQDLEAFTDKGFQRYYQNSGVKVGTTALKVASNIILYKDYGLYDLFRGEVSAQRQSYDYTDATAWNNYLSAMAAASQLVNGKKTATTFCMTTAAGVANKFEAAATNLQTAIDALKATAAGGGVESTLALMEQLQPSNENLVYTDPGYSFFSSANYKNYTFTNYRKEYRAASSFADGYAVRDELGEYVLDADGNKTYNAADSLSVAYKNHRLQLYYDRLLSVDSYLTHLNRAISQANAAGYVEADYTAESYAAYTTALAFANSVSNESEPVQSKVNTAYIELVEAQKRLMAAGSDEPSEIKIITSASNPGNSDYSVEIVTNAAGENLLLGVYPADSGIAIEDYFTVTGGTVTFVYDAIATGETVQVLDSSNKVVYEFVIVMTGDLNQSGSVDVSDSTLQNRAVSGVLEFSATRDSANDYAADFDGSGDIAISDLTAISRAVSGVNDINYAGRCLA